MTSPDEVASLFDVDNTLLIRGCAHGSRNSLDHQCFQTAEVGPRSEITFTMVVKVLPHRSALSSRLNKIGRNHESDTTTARYRSELWLDNITRGLLTKGTLRNYITELSVAGLPINGGDPKKYSLRFAKAGVDDTALAAQLQREGAESFDKSWNNLMDTIASKSQSLGKTTQAEGKR